MVTSSTTAKERKRIGNWHTSQDFEAKFLRACVSSFVGGIIKNNVHFSVL